MKKLFVLLLVVSCAHPSFSQLRMAILGGPHGASVKETNSLPSWDNKVKPGYSSKSGLNLGIMLEIPVPYTRWSFQPGLMYMAKGRKFYMRNDTTESILTDTITASHSMSVNYIEFPLNFTYKYPLSKKTNLLLSAGPYVSFFYNGKQKSETRIYSSNTFKDDEVSLESGNAEGKVKTFDAGFNMRAGLEIGNVLLTGFVSKGFKSFYTASYDGSFKHKVAGVSVGFWLNKPKPLPKKVVKVIDTLVTIAPPPPPIIPDSDGDGMNDEADACPDVTGVVEFNGCPIPDSDGDSLVDTEDKCPTEAGPRDNNGCPVVKEDTIKKEIVEKVNFAARNIFFEPSSEKISAESDTALDVVAELLISNPSFNITIEGHSDSSGKADLNKILSQKRAESVKNYLMQKGVEESRLKAIGYGSERPLDSNKTSQGRIRNRRVELKLAQ